MVQKLRSMSLPGAASPLDSFIKYWPAMVASCMLGLALFMVSYRVTPLRFIDSSIEPIQVTAGETVRLTRTVEWVRVCRLEVSEFWVQKDDTGTVSQSIKTVDLKVVPQPASTGVFRSARKLVVPSILTPGSWYYRAVDRGVCFPWEQWFPIGPIVSDTPVVVLPKK